MTEADYSGGSIDSGDLPRYLYTCQPFDSLTGLYDYGRPYDPGTGRFYTEDSAGLTYDVNLYRYCGNNVVNMTDPTGNCGAWAGSSTSSWNVHGFDMGYSQYSLPGSTMSLPSIPYGSTPSIAWNNVSYTAPSASSPNIYNNSIGFTGVLNNISSSGPVLSFEDVLQSDPSTLSIPQSRGAGPDANSQINLSETRSMSVQDLAIQGIFDFQQAEQAAQTYHPTPTQSPTWEGIKTFPSALSSSVVNGSAWASAQGATAQFLDASADLGLAALNSLGKAEFGILNTMTGNKKEWQDLQMPFRLSGAGQFSSNPQAYNNGRMVGDITARVEAVAAMAYTAVTQLPAMASSLYAYGSGMLATMGLGGGGTAVMVPSVAGGAATVGAPAVGIASAAYGAYKNGVLDPIINWAMMKGGANPEIQKAASRGSTLHSDKPGNLPDQLRQRYPETQFEFTKPGQAGQDVKVVGGKHPSEYPGSNWPKGVDRADFKPNTPGGNQTFQSDQRNKWSEPTHMIPYDPKTGQL
jgi:RHS repeat-associated protein